MSTTALPRTTFPVVRTTSFDILSWLDLRDQAITFEATPLTVVTGNYGHVDVADVMAGRCPLIDVTLTEDGRQAITNCWHTGEDNGWVYAERWTAEGRVFHGYVDSVSRRILQSG